MRKKRVCIICNKEYDNRRSQYCSDDCKHSEKANKLKFEKYKNTMFERYGIINVFQRKDVIEKIQSKRNEEEIMATKIKTFQEKYGVDNPQQIKEVRERTNKTNIAKYGNAVVPNSKFYKDKLKQENLLEYGCEYYFQTDEFKEKLEKIFITKYGEKRPFAYGSERYKKMMVEKYGVENCMQIGEIADKVSASFLENKHRRKQFIFPSGNKIMLQGYENKTAQKLLEIGYKEEDIFYKKRDMPKIYYELNGKQHRYYPDFYIPKDNLIVETKSWYTLQEGIEINNLKFEATENAGYLFMLDVQ